MVRDKSIYRLRGGGEIPIDVPHYIRDSISRAKVVDHLTTRDQDVVINNDEKNDDLSGPKIKRLDRTTRTCRGRTEGLRVSRSAHVGGYL